MESADEQLREELILDELLVDEPNDVREHVREVVDRMREVPASEVREGMAEVRALMLSAGAPAPRVLFAALVAASSATPKRKVALNRRLAKIVHTLSRGGNTGCVKAEFFDRLAGRPCTAYLVLDACTAGHDLGAQLDRVFSRTDDAGRKTILGQLGSLIHCGRAAYDTAVDMAKTILADVGKKLPGVDAMAPALIAHENTTLYLDLPGSPDAARVGIFVRFEDEVEGEVE